MGLLFPEDLPERIKAFLAGEKEFPYISAEEIIGLFYIFGKQGVVSTGIETAQVLQLCGRTVQNFGRAIAQYKTNAASMDSNFTRSKYVKRKLQITVEIKVRTTQEKLYK